MIQAAHWTMVIWDKFIEYDKNYLSQYVQIWDIVSNHVRKSVAEIDSPVDDT